MSTQTELELLLKARKTGTGDKEAARGLADVEKAGKGASQSLGSVAKDAIGMAGNLAGAAGAALATSKALFDLGKSGAEIKQTGESFDTLMRVVGASPDTLERLREASRGTVDDMQLMRSTTALLAGAQGDLATSLAGATPQLLEIAKAANKLNPTLGDTTFMYESLALGIKRGSPMILDNLGLTIKIGEANEKYAQSLGKTVEQLTPAETKQALLNATLEAGSELIRQSGGNADSATDSYARMETAITNVTNKGKAWLGDFLAPAADAIALFVTWDDQLNAALSEQEQRVRSTAKSYDEYIGQVLDAEIAAGRTTEGQKDWILANLQNIDVQNKLAETTGVVTAAVWQAERATAEYGEKLDAGERLALNAAQAQRDLVTATDEVSEATLSAKDVYNEALRSLNDFNIGEAKRIELERELKLLTGELSQADIEREKALGFLAKQMELGNLTQAEYIRLVGELATGSLTASAAIDAAGRAIRNLPDREVNITYKYRTEGSPPDPARGDIGLPGGSDGPVIIDNPDPDGGGSAPPGSTGPFGALQAADAPPVLAAAAPAGTVIINIDARGATSPAAVEAAGYRGAQRALQEAARAAALRARG